MNLDTLYIRRFILVCLLTSGLKSYSQGTTYKFTLDTSIFTTVSLGRFQARFNYIYHLPDKQDEQRYKKYRSLIGQQPTLKNHELYYLLACSLWELEKTVEAEKMFLTIINTNDKFFASTYYHSSDIQGDKTKNIYGYGSFTSNYKNYAAIYLTKIYVEQKQFGKALQFLEDAVKKYKVTYTCGTGFQRQQDEYEFLYASCYEGLNRHKEVIDLLLPSCLERDDEIIITALRKTYTQKEIEENLKRTETSIKCSLDTFPSYSYQTSNYGTKKAKTDTIKYFSGTATITLFDRKIDMPVPQLEDGQRLTIEMLVKFFRESNFYIRLKGNT